MDLYSAQQASDAMYALVTAPVRTARVVSGRSAVSLLLMRESNQPVVIVLSSKASSSNSLIRYSTVVLKSPRMLSSFRATTMFFLLSPRSSP